MRISVVRSNRRTMSIAVRDDGVIVVRAPLLTGDREIRRFAEKHIDWIEHQLKKVNNQTEQRARIQPLSETEIGALAEAAKKDFPPRVTHYADMIGVPYGRITIRNQKTKWGSCSSKGNLNFNCLLMLAPESVRDYVVVHELCHIKQMNHSYDFWNLVEKAMPNYKDAKSWLKDNGAALMLRNPKG